MAVSANSCTPVRLKELFQLEKTPSYILLGEGDVKEAIFWDEQKSQWELPLEEHATYHITINPSKNTIPNANISKLPQEYIQQAAFCCQSMILDPEAFLTAHSKYHDIQSFCTTLPNTPITYGMFWTSEQRKKKCFIAFRGTTDPKDLGTDFDISSVEQFGGQVHNGFWKQAMKIPLQAFLRLIQEGTQLIFCGHSMGGAIAQLVCMRLMEYYSIFATKIPLEFLFGLSFGSPLFASSAVNSWVHERQCQDHIINMINPEDFVPRLLDPLNMNRILSSSGKDALLKVLHIAYSITNVNPLIVPIGGVLVSAAQQLTTLPDSVRKIRDVLGSSVPLIQSFIQEYGPIGTYGVLERTKSLSHHKLGSVHLRWTADMKDVQWILNDSKIDESKVEHHYMESYWKMVMECAQHKEISSSSKRSIVRSNRYELSPDTQVILSYNRQENRCKLIIKGKNLSFLLLPQLHIIGLPIAKDRGNPKIQLLQDPPSSHQAECQCYLKAGQRRDPYPTVRVVTHFDSKTFSISETYTVEGLNTREKQVDIFTVALFQKAYQRALSEFILFGNEHQLHQLYELELIAKGTSILREILEKNALFGSVRLTGSVARRSLIHKMVQNSQVSATIRDLFAYFEDVMYLSDKQQKRTFAFYAIGGLLTGSVLYLWIPVAIATSIGVATGMSFGLIHNRMKQQTECNNITILRAMLDELYVEDSHGELKQLVSSLIEYDCMMLEKALCKKAEPRKILQKSIASLVEATPPIFPNWKEQLDATSYEKVVGRLKASCILFHIRMKLTKQFFIGIVGPQNAGKTTLTNLLLQKEVSLCGDDKHTSGANVYKKGTDTVLVDFAGQTSTTMNIATIANQCGAMVSAFIFLTDFRGDPENTNAKLINEIATFDAPILVCVNQVSRRLDSLPDENAVERYKQTWKEFLQQHVSCTRNITVAFTEFKDHSPYLSSIGVKGLDVVSQWIREQRNELGFPMEESPQSKL